MASTTFDRMSWSKSYGRDRRRTYKGRYERIASYNPDVSSSYTSARSSYRSAYTSPSPARLSRKDTLGVEDYRSPSTSPSSTRYRSSVSPSGGSYRASVSPSASRLRATASVDRDVGYDVNRSYSSSRYTPRYSASVDREIDHDVQQSDRYFGVRQPAYSSYSSSASEEYSSQRYRPQKSYSVDREYTRGTSLDREHDIGREVYDHTSRRLGQYRDYLSESRSSQDIDYSSYDSRSTYSAPPRRTRAASVSRVGESIGDYEIVHRTRRASSVSRLDLNHEEERTGPGWEVVLGPCKARTLGTPSYTKSDVADHYSYNKSYTIEKDQSYDPDEIEVVVTPSGKKAVSYKKFSQYGRGDPKEANKAFKTVEERTKYLETQMTSLEDFVRKNRHLFPEETTIYQQVRFFQLNEEQLRQIGEPPDAEVYGVKIREKLVVPPGTEIAEILNRHYGKSTDVKVEYSNKASKVETTEETETFAQIQERIRNKVEKEFENREKAKLLTQDSYDVQQANKHIYRQEGYEHLHPHVTPQYLKSIYVNAGLAYEDHYSRGSGSDTESVRSTTSRKSKRYDTQPSFTAKLRPKRCMEGQTVRFNCSISGLPPPEVIWFKGSKIINDSARFKITNNYGLLSLEINNVEREDAGVYSIKAINPEGEVACSAPLEVQEVAPLEERGDGTRKPWFVVEATNSWAEVGGKATLEAQAAGRPMPTFKWQKDNVTIHDSDRYRIYTDQQGNTKLVIHQSKESDTGLYFIIAENKAGVAKCAATLRVAERSMIPESERPRRSVSRETTPLRTSRQSYSRETTPAKLSERPPIVKGTKPWFLRVLPSEVKIRVGDPLTLTCVVDGDPKPKVTWLKGVRELTYDKRKRVVVHGDHHLLEVERMLETEAGQYVVVAENPLGRVSCTCWVNILPRREEEDEDFEVRRLKLELPEYEYDATVRGEHLMMRPRFTKKLPLEQELNAGENLEIKCKVKEGEPEFIRTGVDVDVKVKKPGGITEEIITMTKHGAEVSVKDVKKREWSETAPAQEPVAAPEVAPDSSVAPKPVEETTGPKSPELEGEKPVFAVALADKTVKLDSIAKLSVKITARPEPKVQWSKDGNSIKDGGRYEVFEEDGMYHLEVYDVEAVDAGTYQCCATNDIGSATCSCCLTIAGVGVIQKESTEKEPEPAKEETVEPAKEEPTEAKPKEVSPEKQKEAESTEEPSESEQEPAAKEEVQPTEAPSKEPEKEATETEEKTEEPIVKEEAKPVETVPSEETKKKSESEEESSEEESEDEKPAKVEVKEATEEVKETGDAEQQAVAESPVPEDKSATEEKEPVEEEVSESTVEAKSPELKEEQTVVEEKIEATTEEIVQETPKATSAEKEQPKEEAEEPREKTVTIDKEEPKEKSEEKESSEEESSDEEEEAGKKEKKSEDKESLPKETAEAEESGESVAKEPAAEHKGEPKAKSEEKEEAESAAKDSGSKQIVEEPESEPEQKEEEAESESEEEIEETESEAERRAESQPEQIVEEPESDPEEKVEEPEEVKEAKTDEVDASEPVREQSEKKKSVDESQAVEVKVDVESAKVEEVEVETTIKIMAGKAEEKESEKEPEEESESEEEDKEGEEKSKEETKSEPEQVVPSFAKSITDLVVPEGASAKFECEVSGIPDPEITWTKDGSPVATGANVKVAVEGAVCTLCMESVKKEHEGEYICSATNAAGSVSCSATLKIQETAQEPETVPASTTETEPEAPKPEDQTDDKPAEDESSGTEDSDQDSSEPESDSGSESESESQPADKASDLITTLDTPVFSKPLRNITTLFGKEISLECRVNINPLIDVVWIRDGQE